MTARVLVTVLVCDDDERIREVLRDVLHAQPDLVVVGLARDGDEAIMLSERHTPAVVVLDVRMPGGGPRAVREIRRRSPGSRVLAFSAHGGPGAREEMKQAGAADYLLKGVPNREIVEVIRRLGSPTATSS